MQNVRRGDIVLVLFPNEDLQTARIRPALVVGSNFLTAASHHILIAMITSDLSRLPHPSRLLIRVDTPQGRETGLLADSVIAADHLATVSKGYITQVIGSMDMKEVDPCLRFTFAE